LDKMHRQQLLNKTVLANPIDLDFHRRTPVTMYFRERNSQKTKIEKGMAEYTSEVGSDQPMRLYNHQGKQMCSGSYSISMFDAVVGAGSFSLNCFDDGTEMKGELRIKWLEDPKGYGSLNVIVGTADISSGEHVAWIAGIPYALAKKYPELIENAAQ